MNIIEAILSQPKRDNYYIYRKKHDWYLKVNQYESVKYYKNGSKHTLNYLTYEDYIAGDWIVYPR